MGRKSVSAISSAVSSSSAWCLPNSHREIDCATLSPVSTLVPKLCITLVLPRSLPDRHWPKRTNCATGGFGKIWPEASFAGQGHSTSTTDLGVELDNTIYALDSTTIDLSLTLFPWADFRQTKAGIKMHTRIDLRGPIADHACDDRVLEVAGLGDKRDAAGAWFGHAGATGR